MAFLRDEFEFGFVIQRGLLRLGEPRFAERLQARQVVRRDDVSCQQTGASSVSCARVFVSSFPVGGRFWIS